MSEDRLSLEGIRRAAAVMAGVVHLTPLVPSRTLGEMGGCRLHLKLENLQRTGSFKIRGAANFISALGEREKARGVVAYSAGNHAQGVAYAASLVGIPCTVVMPETASLAKVTATRGYGANLVQWGETLSEARRKAETLRAQTGACLLHPFDDRLVMEGQGTIGLEILAQLPDLEAVVLPVGGGGLISGVAMAVKSLQPQVKIYGVQSAAAPAASLSFSMGSVVEKAPSPTLADGIAVKTPGRLTFPLIQNLVDGLVIVDEEEIARAILVTLERAKLLVEGSAAAVVAAILARRLPLEGKRTVAVLSGGNIDVNLLARIIERGMVQEGRYLRFFTVLSDRPGALHGLLGAVAAAGGNILGVYHDRLRLDVGLGQSEVQLEIEARGPRHCEKILRRLRRDGYRIRKEGQAGRRRLEGSSNPEQNVRETDP